MCNFVKGNRRGEIFSLLPGVDQGCLALGTFFTVFMKELMGDCLKKEAVKLKALHTYCNPSVPVKWPFQKVSLKLRYSLYETMKYIGNSLKMF